MASIYGRAHFNALPPPPPNNKKKKKKKKKTLAGIVDFICFMWYWLGLIELKGTAGPWGEVYAPLSAIVVSYVAIS